MPLFSAIGLASAVLFATIITSFAQDTVGALKDLTRARLLAQSNRDPCPVMTETHFCRFEILAKDGSNWSHCHNDQLPSGAKLPARRWFIIIPKCHDKIGLPIWFAPQKILRI
jgi:hypothetical protein